MKSSINIIDFSTFEIFPSAGPTLPDAFSYKFYVIRPSRWPTSTYFASDIFHPEFKSPYIARKLWRRHRVISRQRVINMLALCRPSASSASFAGWIFESYCCDILRGAISGSALAQSLRPMTEEPYGNGSVLFSTDGRDASSVKVRLPEGEKPLQVARDFTRPTNNQELVGSFFLAPSANNPLFDCFFVQFKPDFANHAFSLPKRICEGVQAYS